MHASVEHGAKNFSIGKLYKEHIVACRGRQKNTDKLNPMDILDYEGSNSRLPGKTPADIRNNIQMVFDVDVSCDR